MVRFNYGKKHKYWANMVRFNYGKKHEEYYYRLYYFDFYLCFSKKIYWSFRSPERELFMFQYKKLYDLIRFGTSTAPKQV